MENIIELLFIPLGVSAFLAYIFTPIIIKYATKLKIMDDPKSNHHPKVIHTVATPRGGGIPIFFAILFASLIFIPIDKHLISILIGALIICIMGYFDDRYNLNPYLRIGLGFSAALIPIMSGVGITFLTNPLNISVVAFPNTFGPTIENAAEPIANIITIIIDNL